MGLVSTKVEITLSGKNIKYYENLGYKIPRRKDKYGDYRVKQGTKIEILVSDLPPQNHALVKVECDCCKKEYRLQYDKYLSHLQNGQLVCKDCSKKNNNNRNSPNWNKKSKEVETSKKSRGSSEYLSFIRSTLIRDDYTCFVCKTKGDKMNVHHLNGYHWCIDGRMDFENVVTLCEICHHNFHTKYGQTNNTKEQFEEWIGMQANIKQGQIIPVKEGRKVYSIEDNKIYMDVEEARESLQQKQSAAIYDVCNHTPLIDKTRINSSSSFTVNGKHLLWYDDYIKIPQEEIEKYLDSYSGCARTKKAICVTTNKVFNSVQEGIDFYKCNNHVYTCCKGQRKYCGKLEDGTRLQWMYYEDYLKKNLKKKRVD